MNKTDRENLFQNYLLNEATPEERTIVDEMITSNEGYKAEFESQKILIGFIHNSRRLELRNKFSKIQQELKEKEKSLTIVGKTKPLWEQNYFRYAASSIGLLLIGYAIWMAIKPTETNIVAKKDDSIKNVIDTNKILQKIDNQNPLITKNLPLKGKLYLPSYEYEDNGLGFAKDKKYTDSILVVFRKSDTPQYKFKDTLIISTPKPIINNSKWKILYDRENGLYILSKGKTAYVLEKGSNDEKLLKLKL